jgi:hypothetical protein
MFNNAELYKFIKDFNKKKYWSDYNGKSIDLFFNGFNRKSKEIILKQSIQIINKLYKEIGSKKDNPVAVFIELDNLYDYVKGIPKNKTELIKQIFKLSIPDIVILQAKHKSMFSNIFEEYKCPIHYQLDGLEKNISIIYREYRIHEPEFDPKEEFTRELCLMF